jgi:hypothetical protein
MTLRRLEIVKTETHGLSLPEAVISGRPFRRVGWGDWFVLRIDDMGIFLEDTDGWAPAWISREDLLARDWEVLVPAKRAGDT